MPFESKVSTGADTNMLGRGSHVMLRRQQVQKGRKGSTLVSMLQRMTVQLVENMPSKHANRPRHQTRGAFVDQQPPCIQVASNPSLPLPDGYPVQLLVSHALAIVADAAAMTGLRAPGECSGGWCAVVDK